jgi:uncharacterized phage protein (TIGR01671 family)
MNDRFKLRAWNKETKTMHEVEGVYPYKDESTQGGEVFLKGFKTSYYFPEQVELMQCSGLKDKNGTLIYEGNILKAYYENSDTETTEFDYVPVGFDKECAAFYMGAKHKEYFADGTFIPEEYEVVGNIYENKELLQ